MRLLVKYKKASNKKSKSVSKYFPKILLIVDVTKSSFNLNDLIFLRKDQNVPKEET